MKSETDCDEIIAKLYQELPLGTVCDRNTHTKCKNTSNLIKELLKKRVIYPRIFLLHIMLLFQMLRIIIGDIQEHPIVVIL